MFHIMSNIESLKFLKFDFTIHFLTNTCVCDNTQRKAEKKIHINYTSIKFFLF